jgi:hypothetical protein
MKQTTLDLNGPILSFTTQPVGVASTGVVSGTGSGIATFTGIATASFTTIGTVPNPATNTGIITYRWYEVGVGALSDSTYVTGTATTTLTLSRLITPTDNQRQFYLSVDYTPSAYGLPGVAVTVGSARSTGNAVIEPVNSSVATLTVYPLLEIVAQPSSITAATNATATFTINAGLTDDFFTDDLTYQWYYNGSPITDGTVTDSLTSTTTTTVTTYETRDQVVYRNREITENKSNTVTFTSPGSITLHPTSTNVKVRVAGARGGNGGADDQWGGGSGSGGRFGEFDYSPGGRTLTFTVGKRGNDGESNTQGRGGGRGGDGLNRGGDGGNAGGRGASGGGGGGGGSTGVYDSNYGYHTIIAAGGGGGGGGSLRTSGQPAHPESGGFAPDGRNRSDGAPGESCPGDLDGGGGGGGGAGTDNSPSPSGESRPRQLGGRYGLDDIQPSGAPIGSPRAAFGGGNGRQIDEGTGYGRTGAVSFGGYDRGAASFGFNGSQNNGDGYAQVSYNWVETRTVQEPYTESVQVAVPVTVTTTTTSPRNIRFSGSRTSTLSIVADNVVGLATIFCRVASATALNSPISSDIVEYKVISSAENYFVNLEQIGTTSTASLTTVNLQNGEYTINQPPSSTNINQIVFYAPDRDIAVEMDLYGGKGSDVGSYRGGEGGFSRVRFTMSRNTEYVIAGLTASINAPFVYRKGQLIACVGRGGSAGTSGNGGFGGGVGVAGQNGFGRGGGTGGTVYTAGTLPSSGVFGSLATQTSVSPDTKAAVPLGGRVLPCTRGVYWRNQGFASCQDVGTTQFRLSDGTLVTNTGSITRGFKAGYNIIETAGAGFGNGGNGGYGATGGWGGNAGGGGGGSGYTDGSVTVVSSTLGGSTGNARVVLRVVG